jgi:hypothetical protein
MYQLAAIHPPSAIHSSPTILHHPPPTSPSIALNSFNNHFSITHTHTMGKILPGEKNEQGQIR